MGKKKKPTNDGSLGRSLIRDRFGSNKGRKMVSNNSMLHTTEIQDGSDWGRLNLQSVTEESSFQEFLSTAELAGTEFQAEKLNIKFVNPRSNIGLLSNTEMEAARNAHKKYKDVVKIPRRPSWSSNTTPDELDKNEKEQFLEWRRSLAQLQEEQGVLMTPYEKNLEFWRQLWRVVERSDVIIQITDARNPPLFQCEDLEKYVKEVSQYKMNLILVNKADFLTDNQREVWADYFSTKGTRVVFFSARLASENAIEEEDKTNIVENKYEEEKIKNEQDATKSTEKKNTEKLNSHEEKSDVESVRKHITNLESAVEENADVLNKILSQIQSIIGNTSIKEECQTILENFSKILSREELIELFRTIHKGPKVTEGVTTIGLVGYPNVGKSSTINALMTSKKVSVSATPGKTKHFQTLYLDKDILLCDCPGLVMPSFVFTKAEMILNGILPIDQMRDHVPPTNLITSLIPRHVLEDKYGIMIPKPMEGEDFNRSPTAEELLNAYAYNRGFMTANGQPDNARAARYILKDFVSGKLLYCHAPPGAEQEAYHAWPDRQKFHSENRVTPPGVARAVKFYNTTTEDLDKAFFKSSSTGVHSKGTEGKIAGVSKGEGTSQTISGESGPMEKPWKQHNKHKNKGKKEKLRRVYAHLDQH